jgi:hypothetical protein
MAEIGISQIQLLNYLFWNTFKMVVFTPLTYQLVLGLEEWFKW